MHRFLILTTVSHKLYHKNEMSIQVVMRWYIINKHGWPSSGIRGRFAADAALSAVILNSISDSDLCDPQVILLFIFYKSKAISKTAKYFCFLSANSNYVQNLTIFCRLFAFLQLFYFCEIGNKWVDVTLYPMIVHK